MSVVVRVADPERMHELGLVLGAQLRAGDLVALTGPLGAGKTTLTRGIGEALGVRGPVTSPTFVLARTHPSLVGGPALVHVDAYRLASAVELDDLDIDFDRSVVVVEWGAGMLDGISDSLLEIVIERPTGAGGDSGAGSHSAGAEDVEPDELFEPVELDELIEPRTVTLTAAGPRWVGGVLTESIR